jgi:hypothetical protein
VNANFVIIGLPSSGKTTFLAALWHVVEADETPCRLKLGRYEGDLTYLNEIAQGWRTFNKLPRTSQTGDREVNIQLIDTQTSAQGRAFFPDLAGERFDVQVETRQCYAPFFKNIEEDNGILLFITVDSKQDSLSIVELSAQLPNEIEESVASASEPAEERGVQLDVDAEALESAGRKEWKPAYLPAQVRIVQLLTDLLRAPFVPKIRRLGVILSAWDLVESDGITPDEWLREQMPLVDQFVRSNTDFFSTKIFGLSAQGVSLEDNKGVEIATTKLPGERILVVSGRETSHDLTGPLIWLISGD